MRCGTIGETFSLFARIAVDVWGVNGPRHPRKNTPADQGRLEPAGFCGPFLRRPLVATGTALGSAPNWLHDASRQVWISRSLTLVSYCFCIHDAYFVFSHCAAAVKFTEIAAGWWRAKTARPNRQIKKRDRKSTLSTRSVRSASNVPRSTKWHWKLEEKTEHAYTVGLCEGPGPGFAGVQRSVEK